MSRVLMGGVWVEKPKMPIGFFSRSSFHSLTISSAVTPSFALSLLVEISSLVRAVVSSLSAFLSPIAAGAFCRVVRRNSQEQRFTMASAAVIHGQRLACVDADANFGCRMVRIFA